MVTKHTHQVVFGRRVDGCPRCTELDNGAKPVQWSITPRRERDEQFRRDLRTHNCLTSHCGPVCTFGDW